MKSTELLHDQGQSLWLDNITRDMLDDGTLKGYRDELSITGLTSNPTIFEEAIGKGAAYDEQIQIASSTVATSEQLFSTLALADLCRAADLFRPIFDQTQGLDGWVSMEVSPLLIRDAIATALAAKDIHKAAARPNLFVKIPGTPEGLKAIEETIFAGIPVNVTLLFSTDQYRKAAEAYMRGLERRIAQGMRPDISSVASLFISRWDKAVADKVGAPLRNRLGIAVAQQTYKAYWDLLISQRWRSLQSQGARAQRLLWASTGTKDPAAPIDLYIGALAAPNTINTMPEKTLLAFAHSESPTIGMPHDANPAAVFAEYQSAGIDTDRLAEQLQEEGGKSFTKSWHSLIAGLDQKRASLVAA